MDKGEPKELTDEVHCPETRISVNGNISQDTHAAANAQPLTVLFGRRRPRPQPL
ncbi:hypothetical protein IWW36_005611, partial [Coemansia brasiliensis]